MTNARQTTDAEEKQARGKRLTKAEYDPAIMETVLERWRATHHKRAAAQAAGISEDTLANYLKRGEAGEPLFTEFSARFKKAEADWIAERALVIRRAAIEGEQWQAAAWDLERHLPNDFGRKERLGLGQDPTAGPVGIAWVEVVKRGLARREQRGATDEADGNDGTAAGD